MTLTDLQEGFRDADQRRRVQAVIHERLADDREPQECRYLMRFWWQPARVAAVSEVFPVIEDRGFRAAFGDEG